MTEAVEKLEDIHKAQAINYLEGYGLAHGLLDKLRRHKFGLQEGI
ncbi:MAG: hypothetical protein R6W78_13860 [Bacteroidales bacterium]